VQKVGGLIAVGAVGLLLWLIWMDPSGTAGFVGDFLGAVGHFVAEFWHKLVEFVTSLTG
jgi:hypothetical protein